MQVPRLMSCLRATPFAALIALSLSGCQASDSISMFLHSQSVMDASPLQRSQESALAKLTVFPQTVSLQPGETAQFNVGYWRCCWFFEPVDTVVQWRLSPQSAGSIAEDGSFKLLGSARPGMILNVNAQVDRQTLEARVFVYTPQTNPLVGYWNEQKQLLCDGQEQAPAEAFRELVFHADGTFALTWFPFEIYHDYWGTYRYLPRKHKLSLTITGGNYLPSQTDLTGWVVLQGENELDLKDIFLGAAYGSDLPAAVCGHRIHRYRGMPVK